jgi:hypothetical protein
MTKIIILTLDFIFSIIRGISIDVFRLYLLIVRKPFYPTYAESYYRMLRKTEYLFRQYAPPRTYPRLLTALRRSTVAWHLNRRVLNPSKSIDEYLRVVDQLPNSIEACLASSGLATYYLRHNLQEAIKGFHYSYSAARSYLQAPASQRAPTTLSWRLLAYFLVPSLAIMDGSYARILQWYLSQNPESDTLIYPNKVRGARELAEALGMEKDYYWHIYREVLAEVWSWRKGAPPKMKLRWKRNTDHKD